MRLDKFLFEKGYFQSRQAAKDHIDAELVSVNSKTSVKASLDMDENADIKKILELDNFLEQQNFKYNLSVLTKFLLNDLAKVERCINNVRVPLTQNQYDALVSFIFNVGCNAFLNSTLLKKMRNNNYDANEILKWNKCKGKVSKGLTERRKREMRLFANGCYAQ